MARYSAESLRALLRKRKTATLDELKQALGTDVPMTVYRKLAELGYRSSYSHTGSFYTLDEIARFDDLGLWSHGSARFSKYGSLLATLEALVSIADAGYFASELKERLHVEVETPLTQLVRNGRVGREKISGVYLYCSPDAQVRTHQVYLRRVRQSEKQTAPGTASTAPSNREVYFRRVQQREKQTAPGTASTALSDEVKTAIILFFSVLDEQQRRLFAGLEALRSGAKDRWIADLLGVTAQSVAQGRQALREGDTLLDRFRRPGGGRKRSKKRLPRSSRASKA